MQRAEAGQALKHGPSKGRWRHTTTTRAQTHSLCGTGHSRPLPTPALSGSRDRLRSNPPEWHGLAASGLFCCQGHHSLPCLGLTQRAEPAGTSPGERAYMAGVGSCTGGCCVLGTQTGDRQGKWVLVCVSLPHCTQLAHQHPPSATTLPIPRASGLTRAGALAPIPPWLPGQTHLQVCPGLAQHVVSPGHCKRERDGGW